MNNTVESGLVYLNYMIRGMVKSVGYRESITTGGKFILGSINAQILTRIR